jgi:predicted P-loop ATPase
MQRWTAWKFIPPKKAGAKPAKYPLSLTNDSKTWKTFEDAIERAPSNGGIGFMMLGATSVVGIDLDGCIDANGELSDFASALLTELAGTYAELSPSGKGVRIFAQLPEGMAPPAEFLNKQGVECYVGRSGRFLTVTGNALAGREGAWADFTEAARDMLAPFAAAAGGGITGDLEIKLPVPAIERIGSWQELFDDRLPYKKLTPGLRDYLETGDIPGGRSEKTYAVACRLLETRYHADEVFAVLISAPGSWEAALDKRDQDPTRARDLVWADIGRAQRVLRSEEKSSQEHVDSWQSLGLATVIQQKRVVVQTSQMNALRVITGADEWRNRIALDITTGRVLLDGTDLDDARFFDLQERIGRFCAWERPPNRQWWTDVVRAAAEKNPLNPREAYLRSLSWDGTARLDTWFTDSVAAEDNSLNRILGRKWLLSCVARWLMPGCQCDTVLILQGKEGAGKNTLLRVLAGGSARVIPLRTMDREGQMLIAQAWIAEMPEGALLKRADRNVLKGFISDPVDHYRIPYAAMPVAVQRAFVIVSTVNPGDLLQTDQDGLRRFWPVEVRDNIDHARIAEIREQILAEAVVAIDRGEKWWFDETPADLRERVQNSLEASAVDDAIVKLVETQAGKGGMQLLEIVAELTLALGHRPQDRLVTPLLWKHGLRQRRSNAHRYWVHPSWPKPGERDADIIPLHRGASAKPVTAELEDLLS